MPSHSGPPTPRVLVTGAGGPAGVAVIQALRAANVPVVACDADAMGVGIRLADEGAVLPRSDDPTYIDQLCRLAEKTDSTVLVSPIAEEMPALAEAHEQLITAGLAAWLAEPEAVRCCIDKWRFAEALAERSIATPPTALATADGVPGPWIVKPRFGRGSRDVQAVGDERALAAALVVVPEPLVQSRLTGREFTVDLLVDRDGELVGAVPRWRLETRGGISVKGETFALPALTDVLPKVIAAIGLTGPANVQGFVDGGKVSFTEVNPRFSGGLPLALAAGADLVGEYLRGIHGLPLRRERLTYRTGVRMLRYFAEVFEE